MAEEKKETKKPKHEKFYKDSPKLERGEDGKMGVSRGEKKAEDIQTGTEGAQREPVHEDHEVSSRHTMDRMTMHHKHESEHMAHKGDDKHEMHERHRDEHKAMHKRHEKESKSGKDGEAMIEKTADNKKEGGE